MTRPADGSGEFERTLYVPFPSFLGWIPQLWESPALDRFELRIQRARESSTPESLIGALRTATRFAAVDTGAIEGLYETDRGFTMTIALEAAAWQAQLDARGEETRRAIEDALAAYDFVLDAATQKIPISESWIRQLHATMCASQDTYKVHTSAGPQEQPLTRGEYKIHPNSPTLASGRIHAYAPVLDTRSEMNRLIKELQSEAFVNAHPILQAAYAHYVFVCVHPFADGNGRVARALASVFLYRRPGIPLIVFADQKSDYLDALEAADAGDPLVFVRFIERRAMDAIELVLLHLPAGSFPSLPETVTDLQSVLMGRGGLPHLEIDAIATRIGDAARAELEAALSQLGQPPFEVSIGSGHGIAFSPPDGYRPVKADPRYTFVTLTSPPPTEQINKELSLHVFVALPGNDEADFLLSSRSGGRGLLIRLDEIHPLETSVLRLKLATWVEVELALAVAELTTLTRQALQRHGYLP